MCAMETTTLDSLPDELLGVKESLGSYDALARELGVPVRMVIGWINREHRISQKHLPAILEFLGYTIQRPSNWKPAVIMGGRSAQPASSRQEASASIRYSAQTPRSQYLRGLLSVRESANGLNCAPLAVPA